jgi:hypothetical protein
MSPLHAVPSPQPSEEKNRLMQEYQRTTEIYSAAVKSLAKKMGVIPKSEYVAMSASTEQARYNSMDARDRLERHIAQHGC